VKLEFFAVVTERDTSRFCSGNDMTPSGPILHEMYIEKAGAEEAAKLRASQMRDTYGWSYVARVCVDTEAPENAK